MHSIKFILYVIFLFNAPILNNALICYVCSTGIKKCQEEKRCDKTKIKELISDINCPNKSALKLCKTHFIAELKHWKSFGYELPPGFKSLINAKENSKTVFVEEGGNNLNNHSRGSWRSINSVKNIKKEQRGFFDNVILFDRCIFVSITINDIITNKTSSEKMHLCGVKPKILAQMEGGGELSRAIPNPGQCFESIIEGNLAKICSCHRNACNIEDSAVLHYNKIKIFYSSTISIFIILKNLY